MKPRTKGRSISECLEMHLSRKVAESVKPNFEDVFFGTRESLDIIRQISLIFAAHDSPNRGSKWTSDSNTSAAIFGAVIAILHKSMPLASAEDANFEAAYASGLKTGALISEVMKGKVPSA